MRRLARGAGNKETNEVSELIDIATSNETRPPGVDIFVAASVVAGEEREKVEKTVAPFFNS